MNQKENNITLQLASDLLEKFYNEQLHRTDPQLLTDKEQELIQKAQRSINQILSLNQQKSILYLYQYK